MALNDVALGGKSVACYWQWHPSLLNSPEKINLEDGFGTSFSENFSKGNNLYGFLFASLGLLVCFLG